MSGPLAIGDARVVLWLPAGWGREYVMVSVETAIGALSRLPGRPDSFLDQAVLYLRELRREQLTRMLALLGGGDMAKTPRRRQRKPTLVSVAKQVNKAAIAVARYEVKPDGTVVVVTGAPEPAAPENEWSLDEFRAKETKQ